MVRSKKDRMDIQSPKANNDVYEAKNKSKLKEKSQK